MTAKSQELLKSVKRGLISAADEDYFLIHQLRYAFILDQILQLNLPQGAKILDVGCFPLHLFRALELAGFEIHGISSHHEPIKDKKIVVLNIETDQLPFQESSFDLIVFTEVMEHLLYNPSVYLAKFLRLLRPNGYLLITTPNAVHLKHRLQMLFGKTSQFPLFQLTDSLPTNGFIYHRHNREYTLSELENILTQNRFKISQAGHFNAYSPLREKLHSDTFPVKIIKSFAFLTTNLNNSLKDTLYLLAQKNA